MSGGHTPGRLHTKNTRIYADGAAIDCIATMQVSNQPGWGEDARRLVAYFAVTDVIGHAATGGLRRHYVDELRALPASHG